MTKRKFEIGDRVMVISECKTHGKVGIVTNYNESEYSRLKWVTVQLDGYEKKHIYKEISLIKENESRTYNMALTGNYKIARVQFAEGYNKDKIYNFALFDNDVVEGDWVLCDTQSGYNVAKVVGIEDVESVISTFNTLHGDKTADKIARKIMMKNFKIKREDLDN